MPKISQKYFKTPHNEYDIYGHCPKGQSHRLTLRKNENGQFELFKVYSRSKKEDIQYQYDNFEKIVDRANEMYKTCFPKDKITFIPD